MTDCWLSPFSWGWIILHIVFSMSIRTWCWCAGQNEELDLVDSLFCTDKLRRKWSCFQEVWAGCNQEVIQASLSSVPLKSIPLISNMRIYQIKILQFFFYHATKPKIFFFIFSCHIRYRIPNPDTWFGKQEDVVILYFHVY